MTYTTCELTLDELDNVSAGFTVKPVEVAKSAAAFAGIGAVVGSPGGAMGVAIGSAVGAVVGTVLELIQENQV